MHAVWDVDHCVRAAFRRAEVDSQQAMIGELQRTVEQLERANHVQEQVWLQRNRYSYTDRIRYGCTIIQRKVESLEQANNVQEYCRYDGISNYQLLSRLADQ